MGRTRFETGRGATRRLGRGAWRPARRVAGLPALVCTGVLACGGGPPAEEQRESVVLVHGLGRTEQSFVVMAQRLRWAEFDVTAVGYDSRSAPLEEHAALLADAVANCCRDAPKVHFVGHSMGGIVIRRYLADSPPATLGRVVLLAPPSQGSELAERLRDYPVAAELLGPAGSSLGTGSDDLPASLPPPAYEIGIVAGNRSINPVGSAVIPGADDGAVALDRVGVSGAPIVILPRSHTFIMNSRHAADAVIRFLRTGAFEA